MSQSQRLVLVFLALAWLALVAILVLAPETYDQALGFAPTLRIAFLGGVTVLIVVAALGTVWRWRWMFWVLLVANVAGVLRPVASALELTGIVPATGPSWYLVFQAAIGVVQFSIGLMMLRDLRQAGIWGARNNTLSNARVLRGKSHE